MQLHEIWLLLYILYAPSREKKKTKKKNKKSAKKELDVSPMLARC